MTYVALFHEMADVIFVCSIWYYIAVRPEGKEYVTYTFHDASLSQNSSLGRKLG